MSVFPAAFSFLLPLEGGYTPDQGGTNRGVTQADYEVWRRMHSEPERSVSEMTLDEAQAYYLIQWWAPGPYARIENQDLTNRVFQFAVLTGEREAIIVLQRAAGIPADGIFGPVTEAAVNANISLNAWRVEAARALALIALSNPVKRADLPGWILHRALA